MKIKVRITSYFGRKVYRPDCDMSKAICEITKKTSLSERMIQILKKHGIEVIGTKEEGVIDGNNLVSVA